MSHLDMGRIGTTTSWVWLLALVPLGSALALQPALAGFRHAAAGPPGSRASRQVVDLITFGFAFDQAVVVLLLGASGLLAWLDQRALRARGMDRPFPWGWGFLYGVYLIGRTVVVVRRTGRGAAPLVLAAALFAAAMLGLFVQFGFVFATVLQHRVIHS